MGRCLAEIQDNLSVSFFVKINISVYSPFSFRINAMIDEPEAFSLCANQLWLLNAKRANSL